MKQILWRINFSKLSVLKAQHRDDYSSFNTAGWYFIWRCLDSCDHHFTSHAIEFAKNEFQLIRDHFRSCKRKICFHVLNCFVGEEKKNHNNNNTKNKTKQNEKTKRGKKGNATYTHAHCGHERRSSCNCRLKFIHRMFNETVIKWCESRHLQLTTKLKQPFYSSSGN